MVNFRCFKRFLYLMFSVLDEESTNHYVYNQLPRVNNSKGCAHLIELLLYQCSIPNRRSLYIITYE